MTLNQPSTLLHQLFQTTINAALPINKLTPFLPAIPPKGKTIVVGAGKAAASMAAELERIYPYPLSGLVITRYDHGLPTKHIQVIEASHPVPDEQSYQAAQTLLQSVQGLNEDDLVICLLSGGASALMSLPVPEITLSDKRAVTSALLSSGAPIHHMNTIRKHLSAIKGGQLGKACLPAKVLSLIISDVVGDDLSVIGSGPTVPDPSTFADVHSIIKQYNLRLPENVMAFLSQAQDKHETPKSLNNSQAHLIATAKTAFDAASDFAKEQGLNVLFLGDDLEGEAKQVAQDHAALAKAIKAGNHSIQTPALILSGGETTVTMAEHGKGGRNSEFLLALAIALDGLDDVFAMACDTDGIDGSEDNAGAIITPDTLKRAKVHNIHATEYLKNHNAYTFFEQLDDLIITGPTRTNVNDFRAILIL